MGIGDAKKSSAKQRELFAVAAKTTSKSTSQRGSQERKKKRETVPCITLFERSNPGREFVWRLPMTWPPRSKDIVVATSYGLLETGVEFDESSFFFSEFLRVDMSANLISKRVNVNYSRVDGEDTDEDDAPMLEDGDTPVNPYDWSESITFWTPFPYNSSESLLIQLSFDTPPDPLRNEESRALLADPSAITTDEALQQMLRLSKDDLLQLAMSPSIPVTALELLYRFHWSPVLARLAQNPQTPKHLLQTLAHTFEPLVARNPALPLYQLEDSGFVGRLPAKVRLALEIPLPL